MAHKQHRATLARHIAHLAQALLLELGVAHRQHLVHQQDLRFQVGGDGERQPHVHAGRVALDGRVDELLDPGEVHDFVEFAPDLVAAHAEDGAVEVDVLAPGQLGVEASADLEQAGDAPLHLDPSARRGGDAAQDLEQRALAGAVAPDHAEHLALLDFERHVAQRPDRLTGAVAVVALADSEQRVGLAAQPSPPQAQVVGQRAGADLTELIGFGEVFDGDDSTGH